VVGRKWRDGEGYGAVRALMRSRVDPQSDEAAPNNGKW